MTSGRLLLSNAYFPPVSYFALMVGADEVIIENEESYLKQSWRNRCRIYSANGPLSLSVPVLDGSFHKTPLKEIRIDYSKRWQQVHLGAIESSYRSTPYFEYYFDEVRAVINTPFEYLNELDLSTIKTALKFLSSGLQPRFSAEFAKPAGDSADFRYILSPKKRTIQERFSFVSYDQPFSERYGFIPDLSILDLLFCMGPESGRILSGVVLK